MAFFHRLAEKVLNLVNCIFLLKYYNIDDKIISYLNYFSKRINVMFTTTYLKFVFKIQRTSGTLYFSDKYLTGDFQ